MARLSLRERRIAYKIFRESWLESNKDPEATEILAKQKLENTGLPPVVIEIIVTVIVRLILEWMNSKNDPPEMHPLLIEADYAIEDEDGF